MNAKALIPLVAGLAIGAFALKMGFDTLQKAKGAQKIEMAQIYTAERDIPRGAKITEEMLKLSPFPAKFVPKGAFSEKDKEKLVGRVPRIDAAAGLPVVDSVLTAQGTLPGLSVPQGYRAVAVRIDEGSGVDNHLYPGSRVDVVGYFTDTRGGRQVTIARTLIENVEIGAVGAKISTVSNEPTDEKKSTKSDMKPARAVTLFVKPEDVPGLHLAEQRGKIKISLRSDDDASRMDLSKITQDKDVLGEDFAGATKKDSGPKQDMSQSIAEQVKKLWDEKLRNEPKKEVAKKPEPVTPKGWEVVVRTGTTEEVVCFKDQNSREHVVSEGSNKPSAGSKNSATPAANDGQANPPAGSNGQPPSNGSPAGQGQQGKPPAPAPETPPPPADEDESDSVSENGKSD